MFGKRKNTAPIPTWLDKKIYQLNEDWFEAWHRIEQYAEKVAICNTAITLYPEGADKQKAIKDAEVAKQGLLCAIGYYDDITRQYNEAIKTNEVRITTIDYKLHIKTSHEIIEDYCKRNILKI